MSILPHENLCILVSTWDGQHPLAHLTQKLIKTYWPSHPPMYTCGCSQYHHTELGIPCTCNPQDWMGIHEEVCRHLIDAGMKWVYLILDDHPPLGACNEKALNQTIPKWADELNALYIGLNGWGQGRPKGGGVFDKNRLDLECVGQNFDWKFSLHPGLWNLEGLQTLLHNWSSELPIEQRNAWKFERMGQGKPIEAYLSTGQPSFRVCGKRIRANDSLTPPERRALHRARTWAAIGTRLRHFIGHSTTTYQTRNRYLYRFYDGPYPLYWSGLLQRGQPNNECMHFLNLIHKEGLLNELEALGEKGL